MEYLKLKVKPSFKSKGFDKKVKAAVEKGKDKTVAETRIEAEIWAELDSEGVIVYQATHQATEKDSPTLIGYFDESGNPFTMPKNHEDELLDDEPAKLDWME